VLPLHPLIHHQGHASLKPHDGLGRDGFDLGDIQMEAIMLREHLALHARCDDSGLAHRDGFFTELKIGGLDSPEVKIGVGYSWK